MNNAVLYKKANDVQRSDAKKIIDEFSNVIQWRLDGKDSLIDIGCGSGDVTIDFIYPKMPKNFLKLVGVDVSDKMVRHARLSYQHPRVFFEKLDISSDLDERFHLKFDHVTSFYCLHWVQNQRKAMENIFNLLKWGGDCLLVFLATNPIFDAYKQLASQKQWQPYMKDISKFISPMQYSKNPIGEFSEILKKIGFVNYSVEIRDNIFVYEGLETLKNNLKAVNPFFERMPINMHDEFLGDYIKIIARMKLTEQNKNENLRFIAPYKLLVAYARK